MKLKAKRESVKFDYEFIDGTEAKFEYLAPTTEQIEGTFEHDDNVLDRLRYAKSVLRDCLRGEKVNELMAELEKDGNAYEFKATLDEALGKLKKSA